MSLDVGLDTLEELLMVDLRPRISDNADVLREKVVAVLYWWLTKTKSRYRRATYEAEEGGELGTLSVTCLLVELVVYLRSSSSPDHRRRPKQQ